MFEVANLTDFGTPLSKKISNPYAKGFKAKKLPNLAFLFVNDGSLLDSRHLFTLGHGFVRV